MTKKLLFLLLAAILPVMASAYDACIGDIYYNFDRDSKTAMVTYMSETSSNKKAYSGDVKIPSSVNYGGVEYVVEAIGDHAFYCCNNLNSVQIPHSVLYIYDGAPWQMPTKDQWKELIDNCSSWLMPQYEKYGISGCEFMGTNDGTIFLPAAGGYDNTGFVDPGTFGFYWSSTSSGETTANDLYFFSNSLKTGTALRCYGYSVRPVRKK